MAHELTIAELEGMEGMSAEDIMEEVILGDRHCPAVCSEGCEVEPDGFCPHGFPSLALRMGFM